MAWTPPSASIAMCQGNGVEKPYGKEASNEER